MIDWKSAARAFFRRAEAKQMQLENAIECLAPDRDEELEEGFDSWQDAARHWYEVTKRERASLARERLKNAALLQKLENAANATQGFYDDLNVLSERHRQERVKNAELLQKIEELRAAIPQVIDCDGMTFEQVRELLRKKEVAQPSGNPGDFASVTQDRDGWRERALRVERDMDRQSLTAHAAIRERDELRAELARLKARPSENVADFASLAERIAFADKKKPRDLPDGGWGSIRDAHRALECARNTLAENPTWSSALRCEVEEAMYALACGDMDGFVDELRDVQTVAFRCERAVMERGKE